MKNTNFENYNRRIQKEYSALISSILCGDKASLYILLKNAYLTGRVEK